MAETNKVTAEAVQKLREATGAGVMDCRKALIDAGGDFDQAKAIIAEKGLEKVEKRAGREAGAGFIESYVHNERIGVLLDVRAETDFVVRSEPFRAMAHDLAIHYSRTRRLAKLLYRFCGNFIRFRHDFKFLN